MAAGHDEHDRRQRQLAVLQDERLDVAGQMVHGDERQAGRGRRRLRERHADQQRADQARALRDGDRAEIAPADVAPRRARARRRRRCRGCAAATPAPARRRPTRDGSAPATRRRSSGSPTAARRRRSPRRRRRPSRRTTFRCPGCSIGSRHERRSRPRRRTRASATRCTAARKMPRSVMMPVMKRCGVTSNAGFQICAPVGRRAATPPTCVTSRGVALLDRDVRRRPACSRSIVDSGAAT